jgi:hypothetical protein
VPIIRLVGNLHPVFRNLEPALLINFEHFDNALPTFLPLYLYPKVVLAGTVT